jgi:flavin-dependent dehydrogenase
MDCDVVIIGAGPAGCELARELSAQHISTVLVERSASFDRNNFSSAGAPLEILEEFNLPDNVVASRWNTLTLNSSHEQRTLVSDTTLGVVFDFAKLKEFLSREAVRQGCVFLQGYRFVALQGRSVILERQNERIIVAAKVIVDATGPARAILGAQPKGMELGLGVEYLIETEKPIPKDALQFFLGTKWMPKGYAWIFPMGGNRYKIGAGYRKSANDPTTLPIPEYIERIITEYLQLSTYHTLDKHGGTLRYSRTRDDQYQKDNIIAIGDTVSTVNPLGGEGIRHAMRSARIASRHVKNRLANPKYRFAAYEREMRHYQRLRYYVSEKLSRFVYTQFSDQSYDKLVRLLGRTSAKDAVDMLFFYKFHKCFKLLWNR